MSASAAKPSRSLTHDVYERVRADILACRLAPGTKLHISDLCQALDGVSLGTVREALSRLAAEGLVVAQPQRGFTVTPVSARDLEELTTARIEVETWCLRAAIAKGGVAWEAEIVAAFRSLTSTPYYDEQDPDRLSDAWVAAHAAFHEALVSAAGNRWLLRVRAQFYQQSERYRRLSVPVAPTGRDVDSEHREIMRAALAHDAEAASAALADHLRLTARILLDADLPQHGESPP